MEDMTWEELTEIRNQIIGYVAVFKNEDDMIDYIKWDVKHLIIRYESPVDGRVCESREEMSKVINDMPYFLCDGHRFVEMEERVESYWEQFTDINRFLIDYGTGVGNEYARTIEEAMKKADEGASCTQKDIQIIWLENGDMVTYRKWVGAEFDPSCHDDEKPILFGKAGFYGDWEDLT